VTNEKAFLFTDGRYFLQTEHQLDKLEPIAEIFLRLIFIYFYFYFTFQELDLDEKWPSRCSNVATIPREGKISYISRFTLVCRRHLERISTKTPALESTLLSFPQAMHIILTSGTLTHCALADAENLKKSLELRNSEIVSLEKNLVDVVWAQERPARPKSKIFPLDIKYAGESSEDKLRRLREELTKKKVKVMVINMLDEVAWLFNLRGADINFNPGRYSESTETKSI